MSAVQNYFISYKYQGVTSLSLIRRIKYPIEKYNTKKKIKQERWENKYDLLKCKSKLFIKTYKNKLRYWCFYKNPTHIKFDNGVKYKRLN